MPRETPDWDAQDARDRELLARGAIEELLAAYVDVIRARCRNRCGAHGDDVAQQACLRLWRELSDGKHRGGGAKPFREIVNGVVAFACKGWEGTTLGRDAPLEEWTTEHAGSAADATKRVEDLRVATTEVGDRREKAEDLIEEIKDKLDKLTTPTSRRSDGTWVPELPSGPDSITPRMRNVRDVIRQRFELPYGVGCYRSVDDGGEHPLGRACDFMLSSGGAMPSPEQARLGDEVSAWVIENAERLGIMYVIYKQRIWHVRTGAWKPMSDRGGVTANHYDHPHISVY